jgi:hypothetical protein
MKSGATLELSPRAAATMHAANVARTKLGLKQNLVIAVL